MDKVSILHPPKFVFQFPYQEMKQQIIMEHKGSAPVTQVEFPFTGGIFLHHQNIPYLGKGFPYPEAIESVNVIKRFAMMFTSFSTNPLKWPEQILFNICRIADITLGPHYIHIQYLTSCSHELWHFSNLFLRKLGFNKDLSYRVARVIATLIEYDNAYRFRIEDLFSEITKQEMLTNPRKTIAKMMNVLRKREVGLNYDEVGGKFLSVGKLIRLALLIPKVKKAFLFAFRETKLKDLQLDEADRYWCINSPTYNFGGESLEARHQKFLDIHKDLPEATYYKPILNN